MSQGHAPGLNRKVLASISTDLTIMPPPNDANRSTCSTKFREMLACVENTGTTACTSVINDFLACERAVITTALAKHPPSTSSPPTSSPPTSSPPSSSNATADSHTTPPSQSNPASTAQPLHPSNHTQHHPFVGPSEMLRKIVDKQLAASSTLVSSLRASDFFASFGSFSRRMIADARVSCAAVGAKAAKILTAMRDRRSGTPD